MKTTTWAIILLYILLGTSPVAHALDCPPEEPRGVENAGEYDSFNGTFRLEWGLPDEGVLITFRHIVNIGHEKADDYSIEVAPNPFMYQVFDKDGNLVGVWIDTVGRGLCADMKRIDK